MQIGLIIVGTELLTGKRRDSHALTRELRDLEQPVETLLTLPGVSEGQLMDVMQEFVARFPQVALSCLPHMQGEYRETELGVRGVDGDVTSAVAWLTAALDNGGWGWQKGASARAADPA